MIFEKPEVNSLIKVTTKPFEYSGRKIIPYNNHVLEGKVVESENYDDPLSFRLYTKNKNFRVSVIELKNVLNIEYSNGKKAKKIEELNKDLETTIEVKGSKNNIYIVSRTKNGIYNCTCLGFSFKKTCKHINEVKKKLELA